MTPTLVLRAWRFGALIALLISAPPINAQNETLKELRADFAMRFFEPAPHMALAKYHLDHGNRLLAFEILEAARRTRFEEPVFNQAFQLTFRGFDSSSTAEATLLKDLATHPQSDEVIFKLADLYIARKNWPKAKQYLSAGIKVRPDEFKFTTGLAEVLQIEGNPKEADRLVADFIGRYPDSEDSYAMRAEKILETEPDKARAILSEAREKFPKSGGIVFDLGRVLQREVKLAEAEQSFVEAARLSPNSPDIQAWTGRFLFKVRDDKRRALEFYLNAYFLDPHAYETEFVESRIRNIMYGLAEVEIEKQVKAGVSLEKLLSDSNPAVVGLALEQISGNWKASYLEAVLNCLENDDGGVRWEATEAIKKNADRSFDAGLNALLKDTDLRKRGLAAYLAVHLWKKESFGLVKSMLTEDAQLLRFDAVSALILEGGEEGRKIVFEHAANERNPTLKRLIEREKREKE